jgi:hypothetical protein
MDAQHRHLTRFNCKRVLDNGSIAFTIVNEVTRILERAQQGGRRL